MRFNVKRAPFNDQRVRQALARALDRTALVQDVTLGGQQPAHCLTPPKHRWLYRPQRPSRMIFAGARQLLAEAGFPGGRGFPKVEIQFATLELNQRLLEAVQQMWRRELGVAVTLANKEQRVCSTTSVKLNYDISYAIGSATTLTEHPFRAVHFGWGQQFHRLGQCWIRPAGQGSGAEQDPHGRYELYQQAEALLLEEAPIVPLFFAPGYSSAIRR